MCGIVGIVCKEAGQFKDKLDKMINTLYHRGPDENGKSVFDNCLLGHARLSIVDINSGKQPMKSPLSEATITFNGEIYGYKDIKTSLAHYPFKTKSDTEVVLALYDEFGADMMNQLPGMFSFAIWDENKQRLFCARDRFGEKPFYYAYGKNGEFVFASEIKTILASGLVDPVLNTESFGHYFQYGYIHPYKSIYKNIYVLPAAHILIYENNDLKIIKYWDLPQTNENISYQDAQEKFKYLFEKSVQKQMIADVPVGIFLSGGLDSSSITAAACRYKNNIKTFSFGFPDSPKNELHFAREVAKMYNTEHIELTDNRKDLANLLIEMQGIYDEPFGDHSNIPTYLISKLAREKTKVVMGGDGGDELLAGYRFHRQIFDIFEKDDYKNFNNYSDVHNRRRCLFSDNELTEMGIEYHTKELFKFNTNTIDDVLRIDINSYLNADILVKTDRASMANSLELRLPFLDVEFAEFCISLPYKYKINKTKDKIILRDCYEYQWPKLLQNRPKQGFGSPIDKWFERNDFIDLKQEYLFNQNKKVYNFINYEKINNVNNRGKLWIFLVFAIWIELNT